MLYFCFLEVIITNQGLAFSFFYFIHQGPDSCMSKAVLFARLESATELLYMSLYLQLFFIPFHIFFFYSVSSQFLQCIMKLKYNILYINRFCLLTKSSNSGNAEIWPKFYLNLKIPSPVSPFAFVVINIMIRRNLVRKGFISAYCFLSTTKASQGRNRRRDHGRKQPVGSLSMDWLAFFLRQPRNLCPGWALSTVS